MKLTKTELMIYYLLSCCAIHGLSNGQENAENTAENNAHSTPIEDTAQFHKQNQERRHLLAHLADRMDLDGEGLRHIKKHLGEVTGQDQEIKDVQNGDNSKGIFYFFKLHDYDDNQKLDGLEWMNALTDFHTEDDSKGEFKEGGRMFLEHEAETIVDELLMKHDRDDDGMIDFIELMNSKVNSFMTDLDKPQEGEQETQEEQEQQQEQSSLEQEFNQRQQNQQSSEHNQAQDENKPQENQEQDQRQHQPQQENQQNEQHEQEDQQEQQEEQHQEQSQQESNSEGVQGNEEQVNQQNEPSLEDEYNQHQQQQQQK